MQIDLRTVTIKPLRQTFDNVAKYVGPDKPASRYLEGTIGIQPQDNFHYRPLWDQEHEIFDATRTAIVMKDWNDFRDPRQFYYGTYTLARAKMQETAEADFEFVEERGLAANLSSDARQLAVSILLPLRHVEWGGNMNCMYMTSYGYLSAITQPCLYAGMDHLGMAQYLTRVGLLLEGPDSLDTAKKDWMECPVWQELRRYVEDTFVVKDWFELFVAQNLALDGLLYPLIYKHFDAVLSAQAGPAVSMLTRFQTEWFAEVSKWVDASLKIAAAESAENKAQLVSWAKTWRDRAAVALTPIARKALGDKADDVLEEILQQFNARAAKFGLAL